MGGLGLRELGGRVDKVTVIIRQLYKLVDCLGETDERSEEW